MMLNRFFLYFLIFLLFLIRLNAQELEPTDQAHISEAEQLKNAQKQIQKEKHKALLRKKVKQDYFQSISEKRQNYTSFQQGVSLVNQPKPSPAIHPSLLPAHAESYQGINIQALSVDYYFTHFALPSSVVQTITFIPTENTSIFYLYALHFNVTHVRALNVQANATFSSMDGILTINLDRTLSSNQSYIFEFEGSLIYDCQHIDCYEGQDSVVYLDMFGILTNAYDVLKDLFLLNLQFISSVPNLSFAASGNHLEINPCGGNTCWQYDSIYPNFLPAFVVVQTPPQAWRPNIDLYPPSGGSYELIGHTADLALDYYGGLYFPYPYQRLNIVNMTDQLGVALGPMANVMFPASLWVENNDISDILNQMVLSHELAHQYFYNWVKISDLSEVWMSEGFAQYNAQRFMEHYLSDDYIRRYDYWQYMYNVPRDQDLAVNAVQGDSPNYYILAYNKPASVLQMIRQRLSNFDEIMRAYVNDFALSFASSAEFNEYLNLKTGLSWDLFFQRWLSTASYPWFTIDPQETVSDPSFGWKSSIRISADESLGESKLMSLGVPFVCERDGVEEVKRLYFNGSQEQVEVNCDGGALDPNLSLLRRITSHAGPDVDFSGVVDGIDMMMMYEGLETGAFFGHPYWNDVLDLNGDLSITDLDFRQVYQNVGLGLP